MNLSGCEMINGIGKKKTLRLSFKLSVFLVKAVMCFTPVGLRKQLKSHATSRHHFS